VRTLIAVLILANAGTLQAQQYPSRPIRVVVPLSPGGFADVPTRMLLPQLSAALGKQVFVENKPGAGGTIGADAVAKSAPDGHTLLVTATPHVISAHLYRTLPYDTLKDFVPVALFASGPYALVVNPRQLPVASVRELIAAAKARPGKIDYASSGNGSAQHLVSALFNTLAGIELNHVPYKGSGPAMQDLLGGQVPVSFAGIPNVISSVKAGKLRALAVTTAQRSSVAPDVPTMAESGLTGYELSSWQAVFAPAGTPKAIVDRLYTEIGKILKMPDVVKRLNDLGLDISGMPPAELATLIKADVPRLGKVVKDSGATAN
jgi:tripartite-type tricarboxylate transporter receptor subunit TctC